MTLEELEIVVKANVNDATKKLEGLKAQMDGTGENFKDVAKESEKVAETINQNSEQFQKLSQTIAQVGKTFLKVLPYILAFVAAIKIAAIKIAAKTFKNLRGVGTSVLNGTMKLFQNIGRLAQNLGGTLSDLASKGIKNLVQASSSLNNAMSEISGKVVQLGNALATVVAPVIQALEPLIVSVLDTLIGVANILAQVTASLFGNATVFKKATKVTTDYAGAVGKANNQLAKFDELNVISAPQGGGAGTQAGDMFEEAQISKDVLEWTTKIKEKLQEIKELIGKGDFFGAGDLFGKLFNEEIEKIPAADVGRTIANKINEGLQLINGFLSNNPAGTIGAKLGEFIKAWIDTIDEIEIGSLIANLFNNAVAFVNNFLDQKPFANVGSKIARLIKTTLEQADAKEFGRAIANVIMTAVDLVKDFVVQMTDDGTWNQIGVWVSDSLNELVNNLNPEDIATAIGGFVTGLLDLGISFFENADWVMIGQKIYETLAGIDWGEIILKVVTFVVDKWGAMLGVIWGILSKIAEDIVAWIKSTVVGDVEAVMWIIQTICDAITDTIVVIIKALAGVFNAAKNWWDEKKPGLKEGAKKFFSGVGNTIISIINKVIEKVETGINWIIDKINGLTVTNPFNGDEIWSPNMKRLSFDRLPELADGGVVNKPTPLLAGEYAGASRNPEIVAPQSLLLETSTQANIPVMNSIEEMGDRLVSALNSIGVYAEFDYSKLKVGLDNENYRVGGKLYGV